jgi:hypothetical protein
VRIRWDETIIPDACIDAPGVDRAKLHEYIGNAALKVFDTNLNVQREKPH